MPPSKLPIRLAGTTTMMLWRHYHNVTKLLAAQHIISETMPIVHTPTG
jgi:hypothetical protein